MSADMRYCEPMPDSTEQPPAADVNPWQALADLSRRAADELREKQAQRRKRRPPIEVHKH